MTIPFVPNAGHLDARVAYAARTFAGTVFVTREGELVYALPGPAQSAGERSARRAGGTARRGPGWTLVERFVGGTPRPQEGVAAAAQVNVFWGNDPARWRRGLPTYASVDLGEVWPGIGVRLRAYGSNVEKIY